MSFDFNVNHIPFRFFGDRLISNDICKNLIIESSSNNIELKSNNKNFIFNSNIIFNYGLNLNNIDLSNIASISAKTLNSNTLFLKNKDRSLDNIEDTESIENGYIRATTIGISGSSNAYFTYIDVSGGDSSFNNSVYIKDRLIVIGSTSVSNDLIVNGTSFVTLYNAINNYIDNNSQQLVSAKIVTNDLSATNISISNDLVVGNPSFINDLSISGQMLNNVLKVPSIFTIDPSGHGNASGTLIINGDLMVYGNNTIIASSNVEISDVAISVASNLINKNDLMGNSAGLDISNVASLKYDGTSWNFLGGQVSVENKRLALDVSFIEFKSFSEASLINLNSDIDLSFGQLKNNIDNSYNDIYSRHQIDNSFLLITTFDLSKQSLLSSIDNSYVTKLAFDASFRDLQTYLDASYIIKSTSTNLNIIDSSLIFLSNKLDFSYVSNSVFEGSFNNLKNQIDNSLASITLTSLDTPSISVETINTKHYSQTFNNTSWNQLGLDLSNGGPFNNNYNKVAISNDGRVVAYSKLYSVLDPSQTEQAVTNWTNRTIPTDFLSGNVFGIAWSPSLRIFAAVGYGTNNKRAMYSYDGIDWLSGSIITSFGNLACKSICWSPERSMFVALVGENSSPFNNYKVMTSYDGINWTERAVPDLQRNNWWAHICWSPEVGIFVAVADTGDYKIMTSPDGINWTRILSSSNFARLTSICWSAQLGIFVTINLNGSEVYTSKDGSSWTKYAFPQEIISTYKHSICWSPQLGLFVAVGSAGGYRIITSRNGTDWTPVYSLGVGGGGGLYFVDWIPALNLFIALRSFANDTQSVITSPDGQNWTPRDVPSPGGWVYGAWSQELGILVATSFSCKIMTSSVTTPFITEPAGRVYVYELSYNQASSTWNQLGLSSEIIVGASNEDEFGWDLALSSNGRVVAGSSIASDASGFNCGQVRLFELSNNTNKWFQKGSNINGPSVGSESGYSISLAGSGNSIAIGAWRDNSNGANAGAVRVYDFSASINDWRQKGQTIAGVSGSFEGHSTALSLDGLTLASSSIASIAIGGTITSNDSYTIHTFTTLGASTFTATSSRTVEVLIVGGGGGGGGASGGGGGGGGVIYIPSVSVTAGTNYPIVVGDGGVALNNGQNSSAFTATAAGGGTSGSHSNGVGTAGGSGGGGAAAGGPNVNQGGASSGNSLGSNSGFIYGNRGGHMTTTRTGGPTRAAGGGGAGGQGIDTDPNIVGDLGQTGGGAGGVGVVNAILGPSYYWGGGGGGGGFYYPSEGWGGLGGGGGGGGVGGLGRGGGSALNSGQPGSASSLDGGAGGNNTGGGGGGGGWVSNNGGKGGSGIVVIRYINSAIINTYTISGSTWIPKGIIQGSATNNSYIGRSMKLSANGNAIVIGALGYGYINEYRITPSYEFISTTMTWQAHRTNALTVFGRDLAVILNASQNAQANALRNNAQAFIGGRRVANPISATGKTAADWEWVTGDAWSYENFANGQPDNTNEKTLHFWTSEGKWNDIPLENNYPAIYMYYKVRVQNVERAYVYGHQGGTTWTQLGQTIQGIAGSIDFGSSVNISNDGTIISVGTNDISSNRGYVNVYKYINNYWTLISNTINGKVATFKAGLNALSGDGTTLIQSNNSYYSVYGINKLLTLNSPMTTISGNLIVMTNMSVNSLDISTNHSYSSNGYSYKMFNSVEATAIMKEYYSDVTSTKHLKVQIRGDGNITNINNSYSSISDSRLKENIVTSGPKLEDLLKVRVVNYNLKGSKSTNTIGVLAQELEELFPNLVSELEPSPKDIEEGRLIKYKAVNYSSFDALLIKSLQEQNAMLKNITQRIEALEEAVEYDD
jgi:hypothetical protein